MESASVSIVVQTWEFLPKHEATNTSNRPQDHRDYRHTPFGCYIFGNVGVAPSRRISGRTVGRCPLLVDIFGLLLEETHLESNDVKSIQNLIEARSQLMPLTAGFARKGGCLRLECGGEVECGFQGEIRAS
jgi:hypothetical protein